jgi:hypothetical protein
MGFVCAVGDTLIRAISRIVPSATAVRDPGQPAPSPAAERDFQADAQYAAGQEVTAFIEDYSEHPFSRASPQVTGLCLRSFK